MGNTFYLQYPDIMRDKNMFGYLHKNVEFSIYTGTNVMSGIRDQNYFLNTYNNKRSTPNDP